MPCQHVGADEFGGLEDAIRVRQGLRTAEPTGYCLLNPAGGSFRRLSGQARGLCCSVSRHETKKQESASTPAAQPPRRAYASAVSQAIRARHTGVPLMLFLASPALGMPLLAIPDDAGPGTPAPHWLGCTASALRILEKCLEDEVIGLSRLTPNPGCAAAIRSQDAAIGSADDVDHRWGDPSAAYRNPWTAGCRISNKPTTAVKRPATPAFCFSFPSEASNVATLASHTRSSSLA